MERKSIFLPVLIIAAGSFFQMQALGLLGSVPLDFLSKAWPILFIVAALDFLFVQRRFISGAIFALIGLAILGENFLIDGSVIALTSEIGKIFNTFWPLLMIAFGMDMLLNGRSLISAIVVILIMGVLVYAGVTAQLGISPIKIPDITAGINIPGAPTTQSKQEINYMLPTQGEAVFNLAPLSGTLTLTAIDLDNHILNGTISVPKNEIFVENVEQSAEATIYSLESKNNNAVASVGESNWALRVNPARIISIHSNMESGTQDIDLRGLQLNSVSMNANSGSIRVMLPNEQITSYLPLRLRTKSGTIKIYIPSGGQGQVTVNGSPQVEVPNQITQSGNIYYFGGYDAGKPYCQVEVSAEQSAKVQFIFSQ